MGVLRKGCVGHARKGGTLCGAKKVPNLTGNQLNSWILGAGFNKQFYVHVLNGSRVLNRHVLAELKLGMGVYKERIRIKPQFLEWVPRWPAWLA